jgi:hypothetical protein
MDREELHADSPDVDPVNWPRFVAIASVIVVCFVFVWWLIKFLADRQTRRHQQPTLPQAFFLPVYPQRRGSSIPGTTSPLGSPPPYIIHDPTPSPTYEADNLPARRNSLAAPLPSLPRASLQSRITGEHSEDVVIFGSVQMRDSQVHPAFRGGGLRLQSRASVDTLPLYEEPPSYELDSGSRHFT